MNAEDLADEISRTIQDLERLQQQYNQATTRRQKTKRLVRFHENKVQLTRCKCGMAEDGKCVLCTELKHEFARDGCMKESVI